MDDIARELAISKKTLYQHFENKNDIIEEVTKHEIKTEREEINKLCIAYPNAIDQLLIISKYIVSRLHNINPSVTFNMDKLYPIIWEKMNAQRKEFILSIISQNFQIGVKQGFYRSNLNTDSITVFYTFMLDIKGFEIYKDELKNDFDKVFNTLFMYHLHGIINNQGIKHIEKQLKK